MRDRDRSSTRGADTKGESPIHLAKLSAQAALELARASCSVTRHGIRLLSDRTEAAGEASLPPRRDVGLYSAFTGIVVPFEAGVFGSVTTSTPFLNVAVTLLPSTAIGSRTLRRKAP